MNKFIELKYGIITFILLGVYFFLMNFLGLSDQVLLKLLNILIIGYGVNLVIRYNKKHKDYNYLQHLVSAVKASFIAIILSAVGLFIYLKIFAEPSYYKDLSTTLMNADSAIKYSTSIFIEGIASSLIISFILMQYWKNEKRFAKKR